MGSSELEPATSLFSVRFHVAVLQILGTKLTSNISAIKESGKSQTSSVIDPKKRIPKLIIDILQMVERGEVVFSF